MALEPGSKLGQFEIKELLGAGAMGEVYLASDTKLGRDVAIKVLAATIVGDPILASRFRKEAKTLASLDHHNIGLLYDFLEEDGLHYLVLQLVPGETLADIIGRGKIPLEDALPIFVQIARALEAAHVRGVIHRDLKPANVKVTADGQVKVLDFGIAKTVGPMADAFGKDSSVGASGHNLTATGMLMGTPTYMSPEQARAKNVDKRTDVWGFGCCLFEALAGVPPFVGRTTADLIVKILRTEPDWSLLPGDLPETVRGVLRRCLERDKDKRLKDAGDIAHTLEEALEGMERDEMTSSPDRLVAPEVLEADPKSSKRTFLLIGVASVVLAVLLVLALRMTSSPSTEVARRQTEATPTPTPTPEPVRRFSIRISSDYPIKRPIPLMADKVIVLSPDGRTLVYVAQVGSATQLVARKLDELEPKPIPGTEGAWNPFFSPDGEWLAYQERNLGTASRLMKIKLSGGTPIPLADNELPLGGNWGQDGTIAYGRNIGFGIWKVSERGGNPEPLTVLDKESGEVVHGYPQFIGNAGAILFTVGRMPLNPDHATAMIRSAEGDIRRVVAEDVAGTCYIPTGHMLYARAGGLFALPYDTALLESTGPVLVVTESRMTSGETVPKNYTISENGTLVYIPETLDGRLARTLVWVDREGNEEPISVPARSYRSLRLSPDGRRVVVDHSGGGDIWILDLVRGSSQRITFDRASDYSPIWTPDGRQIVFLSTREEKVGIYRKKADGTGSLARLVSNPEFPYPDAIDPDGEMLIFSPSASPGPVWHVGIGVDEEPRILLAGEFRERDVRFSPDGKWISYESNETDRFEIYVQSYPELNAKWQISKNGGEDAIWNPDGSELFYWEGDQLMVVEIELTPTFSPGDPKTLFKMPTRISDDVQTSLYDIAPDGQRFVIIKEGESPIWASELIVVENWFEELRSLALRSTGWSSDP